jgi:hypothetical protein
MNLLGGSNQRFEKPEPLDVIHMEMGEEDIDAPHLGRYSLSQTTDACAGIEHHEGPVLGSDLDTGRISSVTDRFESRRC